MAANHCLRCGVCCARFRVSFYWRETTEDHPGGVPVEMTDPLGPFRRVMKGTDAPSPRCVALLGTLKESVRCAIYDRRPTPCREFEASWANGQPNERCDRARLEAGLPPLTPEDWQDTPPSTSPDPLTHPAPHAA
ncbi:MAG TPA: YkgJ family cysteine cluster protein [Candidatus Hydrogenedentes bacterium]|nr:YkgJ family cysteine cluster protein [Candidatus Hydrogenedentota bacterium]